MKYLLLTLCISLLGPLDSSAQTKFELDPSQSMLMTGKGPGQDATINPFEGEDCFAVVKNTGKRPFSVRIQMNGEIICEYPVKVKETKKIKLLAGQELYLDPNPEGMAKATVDYQQIKPEDE